MATNYWYQTWKVYPQINMKNVSILPDEGFDVRMLKLRDDLPKFPVYCKPKGKGSKHRLFVKCTCGRDVPFGRMHQHKHTIMVDGEPKRVPVDQTIKVGA